jgi:hypothetical protein
MNPEQINSSELPHKYESLKQNTFSFAGISRTRAALTHLSVSVICAAFVVFAMLYLWYPTPYFRAMGGALLLTLLVCCDVVLGPLITFIIWDVKKRSLKLDMVMIAVLQLAALAYGASVMYKARPLFTVYYRDRFEVVTSVRIDDSELARAMNSAYRSRPLTGPQLVALSEPSEIIERDRMMFHSPTAGDFLAFPQHYVPYEKKAKEAGLKSKALPELKKNNPQIADELNKLLKQKGIPEDKAGFLPLNTKSNDMAVILERENGQIIGMIFANPW